ncbi:hypothetical protein [Bradyrhizobium genosp. P]|uniref:hypothetical protein n=1 Tax=Bradyrhizobium genosp. P TaxID=83641 RepID=UPI003CEDBB55
MAEQVVGSKFSSQNKPGQNGSSAPSSVPTNEVAKFNVRNPAAQSVKPRDPVITDGDAKNWQTRNVSAAPLPPAHGHRDVNASPVKVPLGNNRAVSEPAPRGARSRG